MALKVQVFLIAQSHLAHEWRREIFTDKGQDLAGHCIRAAD